MYKTGKYSYFENLLSDPMHKLQFHTYALRIAQVAAQRSEDPYRQVGAAAFNAAKKTLGTAYNGLASGVEAPEGFWDARDKVRRYIIHAEQNLVSLTHQGEVHYCAITVSPCAQCAALLAAHGVKTVFYATKYENDLSGLDVLDFYGVEHIHLRDQ